MLEVESRLTKREEIEPVNRCSPATMLCGTGSRCFSAPTDEPRVYKAMSGGDEVPGHHNETQKRCDKAACLQVSGRQMDNLTELALTEQRNKAGCKHVYAVCALLR